MDLNISIKFKEKEMFEGTQNFEELEPMKTAIPWAVVVR